MGAPDGRWRLGASPVRGRPEDCRAGRARRRVLHHTGGTDSFTHWCGFKTVQNVIHLHRPTLCRHCVLLSLWFLGCFNATVVAILCKDIQRWTYGNEKLSFKIYRWNYLVLQLAWSLCISLLFSFLKAWHYIVRLGCFWTHKSAAFKVVSVFEASVYSHQCCNKNWRRRLCCEDCMWLPRCAGAWVEAKGCG